MRKYIELNKRKVPYTLNVSTRARSLRLSIYSDGGFVVTTPKFVSAGALKRFIVEKSQWILDKLDYFSTFAKHQGIRYTKADFIKNKEATRKLVEEKLVEYNKFYNFKWNKVSIKDQKTRWGSCSKNANLNFNYKLGLVPIRLAEYVVVHELCHLGQFNHSKDFWNLVAKSMPDYKVLRDELEKISLRYH